MNKKAILILCLLVFILPFLGFPTSWKTFFIMICAIAIASIVFRDDLKNFFSLPKEPSGRIIQGDSYVESTGPSSTAEQTS